MSDRLRFDKDAGRNIDEHLEAAYKNILEWNVEDEEGAAVAALLDPYSKATFGIQAIPFKGALEDIEHAAKWVIQFGELRVFSVNDEIKSALSKSKPGIDLSNANLAAQVTRPNLKSAFVYGRTLHQVILLAGVQVLREYADVILNQAKGGAAH